MVTLSESGLLVYMLCDENRWQRDACIDRLMVVYPDLGYEKAAQYIDEAFKRLAEIRGDADGQ